MELSPGKARAQLKSLDQAARQVLSSLFGNQLPADLSLGDFYRANRYCGSRDRALISSSVYALLRFWGWLRLMLPEERRSELEQGRVRLTTVELGALLAGGLFCENPEAPAIAALQSVYKFPLPRTAAQNAEHRASQLADIWGMPQHFAAQQLLPEWMISALGTAVDEAFYRNLQHRPALWVRLASHNSEVMTEFRENGLDFYFDPEHQECLKLLNAKINFRNLAHFKAGHFEIQDRASQGIGRATGAQPGERWLDACAGAGGKTLQLAALMQGKGTIVAGDVRSRALEELKLRARRAGLSNVQTRLHDGKLWRGFSPCDGVLVDAPCSGSGVWRRNPGAMWTLKSEDLTRYAARQLEILARFAPAVKVNGTLVYSTCSVFPAENEDLVQQFIAQHPEFVLESCPEPWTGETTSGLIRLTGEECDSMFVAKMRRVK